MSRRIQYTEEFKRDAVSQVKDREYSVSEVAERAAMVMYRKYRRRRILAACSLIFLNIILPDFLKLFYLTEPIYAADPQAINLGPPQN